MKTRHYYDEFAHWYETKAMSDRYGMFDFGENLERITAPLLIIAGSNDELTPARDLAHIYEHVASRDKKFCVIGKETGFAHDYCHADLILGLHAPDDVYPVVLEWLEAHRAAGERGPSARLPPRAERAIGRIRPIGPISPILRSRPTPPSHASA